MGYRVWEPEVGVVSPHSKSFFMYCVPGFGLGVVQVREGPGTSPSCTPYRTFSTWQHSMKEMAKTSSPAIRCHRRKTKKRIIAIEVKNKDVDESEFEKPELDMRRGGVAG